MWSRSRCGRAATRCSPSRSPRAASIPSELERETLTEPRAGQLVADAGHDQRPHRSPRATARLPTSIACRARKGQTLILSVNAARLGSPLDAAIEVLDLRGRADSARNRSARCGRPASICAIADRCDPGLRLLSWSALRRGDYIFVDRELMQRPRAAEGAGRRRAADRSSAAGASATRARPARATR